MRAFGKYFPKIRGLTRSAISFLWIFSGIFLAVTLSASAAYKTQHAPVFGIAWNVKGPWKAEARDPIIANGGALLPGTLVHPLPATGNRSMLIFLPDGQRILYECFLPEDCAHSFRIPRLYRTPDPFAVDLFVRIHQVLSRHEQDRNSGVSYEQSLPQDEVLVALGPSNQVEVGGLAAVLPNGEYTYNLRPLDSKSPRQFRVSFKKTASSVTLKLPSSGIYDLTIFDRLNTPRIDLFVAAVGPEHKAAFSRSFSHAQALLADWNEDYLGWPIHDFQRAYLESLFSITRPHLGDIPQPATPRHHDASDTTAEPVFSPAPGLFKRDVAVTLACTTPHAVVHYTVNGSQPFASSPVYSAPIIVKGTALTIKAFASAPGKKDSAVVTGTFRIGD